MARLNNASGKYEGHRVAKNDVMLLQQMVEDSRVETAGMRASEQESYFFAKHYLKRFGPTHDDLLAGIVDGARDGGIDGIYIFVNGSCVRDDVLPRGMGHGADLQLVILQVKNTSGFGEEPVNKLMAHLPELLAIDRDESALNDRYNSRIIEVTRRFLGVVQSLDMPELAVSIAFASMKAEDKLHPNVTAKADRLKGTVKQCFGSSQPSVVLLDAAEISALARFRPPTTKVLLLAENPISTDTTGGYIGVATLEQYNRFITEDSGRLDLPMFEANVRDYESDSGVNESIQETLREDESDIDFWWLNNGVTVVANKVQLSGKRLSLSTPQVVNGLQTSYEIYKRGAQAPLDSTRSVLVKVIEVDKDTTKDRIIKATNSQTTLETSTLRATDKVQRKIEEHLTPMGLYYERRKNYYRNQQIPLAKLVSIEQLGQAVVSVFAQTPHVARGESSKIFDDGTYELVFHDAYPLAVYSQAIKIQRACEAFLRDNEATRGEVDNFVFHLSMLAAIALTRKERPTEQDLAALDESVSDDLLRTLLDFVRRAFGEVVNSKNYAMFEQVSKDRMSTERLRAGAQRYLRSSSVR